jgi:hypothetical protein
MAKAIRQTEITIPPMNIQSLEVVLIGDSPLVVHAWSDKAKKMMLDKQMKKAMPKKEAKSPEQDFIDSLYWCSPKPASPALEDVQKGQFGFPAIAFKAAAVDACSHVDGMTKVAARGAFHIDGDLVRVEGAPTPREDMVRLAMGIADIRYRAEFRAWRVRLRIRYNANVISAEQIVNLFETAGFAIGVGEHRPQRNGQCGRFHVARQGE